MFDLGRELFDFLSCSIDFEEELLAACPRGNYERGLLSGEDLHSGDA